MQLVYYSDLLEHHGIKGQKWGERNGPPYPLDSKDHSYSEKRAKWRKSITNKSHGRNTNLLREVHDEGIQSYEKKSIEKDESNNESAKEHKLSDSQKKTIRNIAIGVAAAAGIGAGIYFAHKYHGINRLHEAMKSGVKSESELKETLLQAIDESTQVLKQGSILHRMSAYGGLDYSEAKKPMYLSFRKEDVATYMTLLRDHSRTGKRYDVVFEAVEDLKLPTKKKAIQVFEDLWNNDPKYKNEVRDSLIDALVSKGLSRKEAVVEASMCLNTDPFKWSIFSIVRGNVDSEKLIDKLKSLGYNAIEDYFDKGEFSKSPIIAFNPSKSLVNRGETFVDRKYMEKTLVDLLKHGTKTMGADKYYVTTVLRYVRNGALDLNKNV